MTQPTDITTEGSGPRPPAPKRRHVQFLGPGALVQLLGLVILGLAGYYGFQPTISVITLSGLKTLGIWAGGLTVCVVLFMTGSEMSKKFACGYCGSPLADKHVTTCPKCGSPLR